MIKRQNLIRLLGAFLIMFLFGSMSAFAGPGGDDTVIYKSKGYATAVGSGTVYVSTSSSNYGTGGKTAETAETSNEQSSHTYYYKAEPASGASFEGWFTDEGCTQSHGTTSTTTEKSIAGATDGTVAACRLYAKFSTVVTKSKLTATAVGDGLVYAGNSNVMGALKQSVEATITQEGSPTHTYWLFAEETANSQFVGWFTNSACTGTPVSTELEYSVQVTGTTNSVAEFNYYAKFNSTYTLSITMKGADMLPQITSNGVAVNSRESKQLQGSTIVVKSDEYVTVNSVTKNGSALQASAGQWTFTMDGNVNLTINATVDGIPNSRWMSAVPDRAYICNLSIPGAHQAGSDSASGTSAKCQDKTVSELFDCGVRVYDFRPYPKDNNIDNDYSKLGMRHGETGFANYDTSFPDVIDDIVAKLQANPTEFCIVLIRHEDDSNPVPQAQVASYASRMRALVNDAKYKPYFINFRRDLRMGDVRGKILMFSPGNRPADRWGSADVNNDKDYTHLVGGYSDGGHLGTAMLFGNLRSKDDPGSHFFIQNCYDNKKSSNVSDRRKATSISKNDKLEAVKDLTDVAAMYAAIDPEQCAWFINHTSGVGSGTLESSVYNVAEVTNPGLLNYIKSNPFGTADSYGANPLGMVLMDYAGVDSYSGNNLSGMALTQAIIDTNFTDEMMAFHNGTDDVCFLYNVGTGKFLALGGNWATQAVLADHPLAMRIVRDRINNQILMRFPGTRTGEGQGQIGNFVGYVTGEGIAYADKRQEWERVNEEDNFNKMIQQVWWNVSSTEPGAEFTIDLATAKGRNATYNGANSSYTNFGWVGDKLTFGATGDNAKWIILTKADMNAMLEEADANNPVDITGFIANPRVEGNGGRKAYDKVWDVAGEYTAIGLVGSDAAQDINRGGVEFWNRANSTTMSQKVVLAPGTYRLELDGYYRNGMEHDAEVKFFNREQDSNWPVLFVGNVSVPVATMFDRDANKTDNIPSDFDRARENLRDGKYKNVLFFTVDGDNAKEVEIGIRKNLVEDQDWLVLNGFRLYGYGKTTIDQRAYVEASDDYKKLEESLALYTRMANSSQNQKLLDAVDTVEREMTKATTIGEVRNLWAYLERMSWRANDETDESVFEGSAPVHMGEFYLYNVGRKTFLSMGNVAGTHAIVGTPGIKFTLEQDGEFYFLNSHRPNGEGSEYLDHTGWVDHGRVHRWKFVAKSGGYQIVRDGNNNEALGPRPGSNEIITNIKANENSDNIIWKLVSEEEFEALMDAHNENFDPYKLINISHKIQVSDFDNRTDLSDWVSTYGNGSVLNHNQTNDGINDFAWEFWNCENGELYQTIEGLRPGNYWISCNALYRPMGHDAYVASKQASAAPKRRAVATENDAELFAYAGEYDSETVGQVSAVPEIGSCADCSRPGDGQASAIGEIPNSVLQATNFFNNGLYKVDYVKNVEVGDDGKLTIGVRKKTNTAEDWLVVDNFRLYYANNAEDGVTGVEDVEAEEAEVATEYYNLQGVRVENPGRGIYIRVRGEKVDKVRL